MEMILKTMWSTAGTGPATLPPQEAWAALDYPLFWGVQIS